MHAWKSAFFGEIDSYKELAGPLSSFTWSTCLIHIPSYSQESLLPTFFSLAKSQHILSFNLPNPTIFEDQILKNMISSFYHLSLIHFCSYWMDLNGYLPHSPKNPADSRLGHPHGGFGAPTWCHDVDLECSNGQSDFEEYTNPRDPSTFLGSVWDIIYHNLEGWVPSQAVFGSIGKYLSLRISIWIIRINLLWSSQKSGCKKTLVVIFLWGFLRDVGIFVWNLKLQ